MVIGCDVRMLVWCDSSRPYANVDVPVMDRAANEMQ